MDINSIDWNALWKAESGHACWNTVSQKELWNRRADSFSQRINRVVEGKEGLDKDDYISRMLERIKVKPEWSVLDIGAGPGTLTIPLAKKVRSITALDISAEMLKHLKANARKSNLNNIRYINAAWQDAFQENRVEKHDVVIASRSLMSGEMRDALTWIAAASGRAAYLTFPIIHLPFDWEVYELIGRGGKKHAPYIYICNMLYQMGIEANVEILYSKIKVQFSSMDEAIDQLQWRTDPFNPQELAKLREYLGEKFAGKKPGEVFTHEGYSKWALVWWSNDHD
jgi:predicted TPR repeat methyltransferase